ncbi:MAG: transcription elongation factor Spt5 [Candidatus Methanomethylophilaceae archaeon]|nr:transcription elongation factor Spt5 [Candidatus Methanomethylophilaceae archaeon]MDY0223822.1 transcription elongation factor Spt5 [Candidatus Methanomethylophilaceae archaeon]
MSDLGLGGPIMAGESGTKDVHAGGINTWKFQLSTDVPVATLCFDIVTGPDSDNAPEWTVTLYDSTGGELWSNYRSKREIDIDFPGKGVKEFKLEIICPKGARYGDTVDVDIQASSTGGTSTTSFGAVAKQSIMVLKTQIDQEKTVADALMSKANVGEKDIFAVFSPAGLRGYVFVEGMNTDHLREKTRDIKKARSFVDGETSIDEISHYLVPVSAVIGMVEGDLVELINGPFKGEIARVQQIDQAKEEITVELVEAMVPIPVTVKGDSVRIIEKEK